MPQVALQDHEGYGSVPGFGRLRADTQRSDRAHSNTTTLPRSGETGADHREEGRKGGRLLLLYLSTISNREISKGRSWYSMIF